MDQAEPIGVGQSTFWEVIVCLRRDLSFDLPTLRGHERSECSVTIRTTTRDCALLRRPFPSLHFLRCPHTPIPNSCASTRPLPPATPNAAPRYFSHLSQVIDCPLWLDGAPWLLDTLQLSPRRLSTVPWVMDALHLARTALRQTEVMRTEVLDQCAMDDQDLGGACRQLHAEHPWPRHSADQVASARS